MKITNWEISHVYKTWIGYRNTKGKGIIEIHYPDLNHTQYRVKIQMGMNLIQSFNANSLFQAKNKAYELMRMNP